MVTFSYGQMHLLYSDTTNCNQLLLLLGIIHMPDHSRRPWAHISCSSALAGLIHSFCIYARRVQEPARDTCQFLMFCCFINNYTEDAGRMMSWPWTGPEEGLGGGSACHKLQRGGARQMRSIIPLIYWLRIWHLPIELNQNWPYPTQGLFW